MPNWPNSYAWEMMPESLSRKAEAGGSGVLIDEQHSSVRRHGLPTEATAITKLETEMIAKGMTKKRNTEHRLNNVGDIFFYFSASYSHSFLLINNFVFQKITLKECHVSGVQFRSLKLCFRWSPPIVLRDNRRTAETHCKAYFSSLGLVPTPLLDFKDVL